MSFHLYRIFPKSKTKLLVESHLSKCIVSNYLYDWKNFCTQLVQKNVSEYVFFNANCSPLTKNEIHSSFIVLKDFINSEEEENLVKEIEPHVKRLKYEFDHWDDAIHGYREIEKSKWSSKCSVILKKLKDTAFHSEVELIPQVHVLDLSPEGCIKPHIDSVRFCGSTISGLCLLSDAVMRLIKEGEKDQVIDILLPRRGLYLMKDASRYKYTHEILSREMSYFGEKYIDRSRRISIICRNYSS